MLNNMTIELNRETIANAPKKDRFFVVFTFLIVVFYLFNNYVLWGQKKYFISMLHPYSSKL
jgi:hypothetical protein